MSDLHEQVARFLESRLDNRYTNWDEIPCLGDADPGAKQGAKRVIDALNKKEHIYFVHDSDADGVGSATIMNSFFDFLNYKNRDHRITNRQDGYGFLPIHVDEALKLGSKLIITSDNGITSKEATDYAYSKGIDVIITDHHTVDPNKFPDKAIIVDPQTGDDSLNDFKDVSGTVVAYLFEEEVARQLGIARKDLLAKIKADEELGITTISDVMKLQHMNRLFVKEGLKNLNNPRKPYAKVFKNNLKYESIVNSETIGFSLAPTLNAANRFGVAEYSYNFLTAADESTASQYWNYLTHLNEKRKSIVQQYVDLLKNTKVEFGDLVYVNLKDVEKGILGLLANKLAGKYNKPAIVTCTYGDKVFGSGRSVGQVDMLSILRDAEIEVGGHKQAFGCNFDYNKIPEFVKKVSSKLKEVPRNLFSEDDKSNFKIVFNQIDKQLFDIINSFEPYGHGFEKPVFATDVVVVKAYRFGKQKNHTKFILKDVNNDEREIVAFFETRNFRPGDKLQVNYVFHWDEWNKDIGIRIKQIFTKG